MLTTTTDGLWVLQVLSRTEVLAPELGLRPYLPSVETEQLALRHPVAEELRSAGVINDHGGIDDILLEWLTVLSRRDVALLLDVRVPTPQGLPDRVMLARFAQWWVTLERRGSMVRLSGVGVATSEESAATLISAQIQRSCGAMRPAAFRPVTLGTADLLGFSTTVISTTTKSPFWRWPPIPGGRHKPGLSRCNPLRQDRLPPSNPAQ